MAMNQTIYVIDDDASARGGIVRYLRTAGYVVNAFESLEALAAWNDPVEGGCLVMDVCMPGRSLEELQGELAEDVLRLPMIFVTANRDTKTRARAKALKASAFFYKPVDGPALVDAIEWSTQTKMEG